MSDNEYQCGRCSEHFYESENHDCDGSERISELLAEIDDLTADLRGAENKLKQAEEALIVIEYIGQSKNEPALYLVAKAVLETIRGEK